MRQRTLSARHPPISPKETVLKYRSLFIAAAAPLAFAAPALAQDADETPEWEGEGSLSAGYTTGNTETTDFGAGVKLKHNGELWTQSGQFSADYGETDSVETKNRLAAAGQVDRILSERLSAYGRGTGERRVLRFREPLLSRRRSRLRHHRRRTDDMDRTGRPRLSRR